MDILILGGTSFLSATVVQEALTSGHHVTCLARGITGAVPDGAALIKADRSAGPLAYQAVERPWDAVVDVSSEPALVTHALSALGPMARHWTYVSSCSVYEDQDTPELDESAATVAPLDPGEELTPATYAAAKAACEAACFEHVGDRLHLSRPGLIGGPGDPSDRFGYWPARFAMGRAHPVVIPDAPQAATQTIDVRDLARWIVTAADERITGTFNAVGEITRLQNVLDQARTAAQYEGEVVSIDPNWLTAHGVAPWSGPDSLPLWIPDGSGFNGFARRSCTRALEAGLRRRPLLQTVSATLDDEGRRGVNRARKAGLAGAFEAELLTKWANQTTNRSQR